MNFLIWNVRGLNHQSKQKEVKRMIKCHKIRLICLIETRVKMHKVDEIRSYIVPNWDSVYNYDQHFLGGFGFARRRMNLR
jgi:exonuclease III